jgi:hypothetical protein
LTSCVATDRAADIMIGEILQSALVLVQELPEIDELMFKYKQALEMQNLELLFSCYTNLPKYQESIKQVKSQWKDFFEKYEQTSVVLSDGYVQLMIHFGKERKPESPQIQIAGDIKFSMSFPDEEPLRIDRYSRCELEEGIKKMIEERNISSISAETKAPRVIATFKLRAQIAPKTRDIDIYEKIFNKRLTLSKESGDWKIESETTIKIDEKGIKY